MFQVKTVQLVLYCSDYVSKYRKNLQSDFTDFDCLILVTREISIENRAQLLHVSKNVWLSLYQIASPTKPISENISLKEALVQMQSHERLPSRKKGSVPCVVVDLVVALWTGSLGVRCQGLEWCRTMILYDATLFEDEGC